MAEIFYGNSRPETKDNVHRLLDKARRELKDSNLKIKTVTLDPQNRRNSDRGFILEQITQEANQPPVADDVTIIVRAAPETETQKTETETSEETDPHIFNLREAQILTSLIIAKDHAQIIFKNKETVMFDPSWIIGELKELGFSTFEVRIKSEELANIRKTILDKAEKIIEANGDDPSIIEKQQQPIALLLTWMAAGGEISTSTQEMTRQGLVKFLLSANGSVTKTDQAGYLTGFKQTYNVVDDNDFIQRPVTSKPEASMPSAKLEVAEPNPQQAEIDIIPELAEETPLEEDTLPTTVIFEQSPVYANGSEIAQPEALIKLTNREQRQQDLEKSCDEAIKLLISAGVKGEINIGSLGLIAGVTLKDLKLAQAKREASVNNHMISFEDAIVTMLIRQKGRMNIPQKDLKKTIKARVKASSVKV